MKTRYFILAFAAIAVMNLMGSCSSKSNSSVSQTDSVKVDTTKADTVVTEDTVAAEDTIEKEETLAEKITTLYSETIDSIAEKGKGKCIYYLFDITGDSIPDLFLLKKSEGKQKLIAYAYSKKGLKEIYNDEIKGTEFFCDGKELRSASYIDSEASKGSWKYKKGKLSYNQEMKINGVSENIYEKMKPDKDQEVEWAESKDKESLEDYIKYIVKE